MRAPARFTLTQPKQRKTEEAPQLNPILPRHGGISLGAMLLCLFFPAFSEVPPAIPAFIEKGKEAHVSTVVVSGDPVGKRFLLESVGGGLAVIDYNNDGWMDLYITNGGTIESSRSGTGDQYPGGLYRNNRDDTFTDEIGRASCRERV